MQVSDVMILLDDTLFAQGFTFVNRNRLKGPDGEIWVTVPVKKIKGQRQKIREIRVHEPVYWGRKWQGTLYHAYGRSLFYNHLSGELGKIMAGCGDGFLDLVVGLIGMMKSELDINTTVQLQSETGIRSGGVQLLTDLAEEFNADEVILPFHAQGKVPWKKIEEMGIKVTFLRFLSPVYPQFWGPFQKNLSALDLLFCMGPQGRRVLETGYKIHRY